MAEFKLDFSDTEIAFSKKSDADLRFSANMFRLMNSSFVTNIVSKLGLVALKFHIPFTKSILMSTMYRQFCGGETLVDCQPVIDQLYNSKCLTILDYSSESKSEEEDLNFVRDETIRAMEFAASNMSVPVVSSKFTGLVKNEILEKMHDGKKLSDQEQLEYKKFEKRADDIAAAAYKHKVAMYVDAEDSWYQKPIDILVEQLMEKYNKESPVVYNTYQMYINFKLDQLKSDFKTAQEKGYFLGAKLVRGAYMDKERDRAKEMGYPSPIFEDKDGTDKSYDDGVRFIVEHYESVGSCNASHNAESNLLQARLMYEKEIALDHKHINFAQLYGMSDNITFNLSNAGYNTAKYLPYGAITEVYPYLVRRAQENKSIAGDMGKELKNIVKEQKRRKAG